MRIQPFLLTLLVLFTTSSFAQETGTVSGTVLDAESKEILIGVNILAGDGVGTTTDIDGNFTLTLTEGKHELVLTYVGYETIREVFKVQAGKTNTIQFLMEYESIEFDEIVISGSRYAKRVSEEVISIEVIKPALADNSVSIRLDELAKRITGVNVADGQASIRAGSGWSFSIGSRVNMVMDGQSILTPDRSSIKWQYLPMENIGQIEVLKGASSILYGSSAMNGTIHLQTIKPQRTAENKFVVYAGWLDDYENDDYNWWTKPRMQTGGYFSRAHKVSDHFEYVLGINGNYSQLPYYQYNDYHLRTNLYTKWTSKKDNKSNYGFRLNYAYYFENEFVFWEAPDEKALFPIDALDVSYHNFNVDPYYVRYDKKNNKHLLQGRLYYFDPEGFRQGGFVNAEYQFSKRWTSGWNIVAGGLQDVLLWYDDGLDPFFNSGMKWALYTQVDRKWPKISLTGGMRSEIFKFPGADVGLAYAMVATNNTTGQISKIPIPLMRFGLNYHPRKNTYVRFNIGQAFRLPSVVEYYVEYEFSGISILANDDLVPEYGWTSEIGLKQNWRNNNKYKGSFDFAFFWQAYKDLIEFQPRIVDGNIALVPQNLPAARIAGYEVSIKQSVNSGQHRVGIDFGYTYAFPMELSGPEGIELKSVGPYLKSLFKYAGKISKTPRSVQNDMLKYRNRHLVNGILEYENDHFLFGFYARYYSNIENGDFEFDTEAFTFIPGITEYWAAKFPKGDFVADMTVGFKIEKSHMLSITLKNLTNREYSLRLGKIEPPRSFVWKYQYKF